MKALTLDEIDAALAKLALAKLYEGLGLSRADIAGFHAHGIPADWADAFAKEFGIPISSWPRVIPRPSQLQHGKGERIIRTMDVNTHGHPSLVQLGAARARRKSAAQRKLYQHGKTISSLAKELDEGRSRVSAWFATGDNQRPVPSRHRGHLAKYGITENDGIRFVD